MCTQGNLAGGLRTQPKHQPICFPAHQEERDFKERSPFQTEPRGEVGEAKPTASNPLAPALVLASGLSWVLA